MDLALNYLHWWIYDKTKPNQTKLDQTKPNQTRPKISSQGEHAVGGGHRLSIKLSWVTVFST